jgi:hypothetical protein
VCIKSFIHREKRGAHKKVPRGEIRRGEEEDEERAESINVCSRIINIILPTAFYSESERWSAADGPI